MNWDHAVSWGRRVWVSVSDIGRVGHTESDGWPTGIEKNRKRVSCGLAWVVVRQKHTCVTNRHARHPSHPMPLALILPRGDVVCMLHVCMCVYMYVCVYVCMYLLNCT